MDVHCKGSYVTKAVPDGPPHCQVDRLDFDGKRKAVGCGHFGHISLNSTQTAPDLPFTGECMREFGIETFTQVTQKDLRQGV